MAGFIIFTPLGQKEATKTWARLQKWFRDNPERKSCTMDCGIVNRKTMKKDFLKVCAEGVILGDVATKTAKPRKKSTKNSK